MVPDNVFEILEQGFIGLAFLLAFLAYKLLSAEQKKEKSSSERLELISNFMKFSLVLCVMAIGSPHIPALLEEKTNPLMEHMLESAKNRTPMDKGFIEKQIEMLIAGHESRLKELSQQRLSVEQKVTATAHDSSDKYGYNRSLSRIEQYVRQENRELDRKIRDLRSML